MITEENPNNLIENNNYSILDNKIKKERYHRKNNKILITELKNDKKNIFYKRHLLNRINSSFIKSGRLSKENIKKTFTIMSPTNKFIPNKEINNNQRKQFFHILKLNSPIMYKRINNTIQNKNYHNTENNTYKYQKMYLNNNENNFIINQSQIGANIPSGIVQFQLSKIGQKKKSFGNNNHSYHEICSLSSRNSNTTSKTVYHDYSNLDKKIISNKSSQYINNIKTKYKKNEINVNKNYSLNNIQKNESNNSQNLYLEENNELTIKELKKEIFKLNNKNNIDGSYIVFNDVKSENNYNYSRNGKNTEKNLKYNYQENPSIFNKKYFIRYANTVSRINNNYNSFKNNNTNDEENINYIYQDNIPYNRFHRVYTFNNKDYPNNNYTFQNRI